MMKPTINPFYDIPVWLLWLTRTYVGLLVVLVPSVQIIFGDGEGYFNVYLGLSMLAGVLSALPVILPFKNVGLIHPLIYPFYFSLLKTLGKNPFGIFNAFNFSRSVKGTLAFKLETYEMLDVNLEAIFLEIIWIVMLYVGYSIVYYKEDGTAPPPKTEFPTNRYYAASLVFIATGLVYFQAQGGLLKYVNSWGVSRSDSLEGMGPIIIFLTVAFLVPLAWYAHRGGKAFSNPVFLTILVFSTFVRFLASGSRSSILIVIVSFLIVYLMQQNKIPWKRAFFSALFFFVIVGAFGKFRQATWRGEANWDIIFKSDVSTNVENTLEEGALWNELGASNAVYTKVPDQVDYLYGKTYLTGLLFFVPRFIWKDKPHSAGYYTGKLIFNRLESGIPPGNVAEAFWNFSYFGVFLVAFLNGVLIKLGINYYRKHYNSLFVKIIYIIILTNGFQLAGLAVSQLLQRLLLIVPLLKFLKVK